MNRIEAVAGTSKIFDADDEQVPWKTTYSGLIIVVDGVPLDQAVPGAEGLMPTLLGRMKDDEEKKRTLA